MSEVEALRELVGELGIREHGIEKSLSGGCPLESELSAKAEDFLQAAEDAFELSKHAAALGEAKRAIHCQIDEVLDSLGYPWRRTPLTKKLNVIKKCGFAAPRILQRVNAARNLLEHEYVQPSPAKAAEALDIATLFVNATRRHLETFMADFYVGNGSERVDEFHFGRELSVDFRGESKTFVVRGCKDVPPERSEKLGKVVGKISINSKSPLFPILVKLTIAGERESKTTVAFHNYSTCFARKAGSYTGKSQQQKARRGEAGGLSLLLLLS